jgi:hypothetical protein
LRGTLHTIDPMTQSFNERAVNFFRHHLFHKHLEELIDRVVCGAPPTTVLPPASWRNCILSCTGAVGSLVSCLKQYLLHAANLCPSSGCPRQRLHPCSAGVQRTKRVHRTRNRT